MTVRYCQGPDCDRPARAEGGEYCDSHTKQLQRTGKLAPIAEKLTPEQRYLEAVLAFADADPMDDVDYDRKRRAALLAGRALHEKIRATAIRRGMAKAKKAGKRISRPKKVTDEKVQRLFEQMRSLTQLAEALGVSKRTLRRRRPKAVTRYPSVRSSTSPRAGGSST